MVASLDPTTQRATASEHSALAAAQRRWIKPKWAWPRPCELCGSWGHKPLCSTCVVHFAPRMPRCGHCAIGLPTNEHHCGDCLRRPPSFDRALAAVDYTWPWNQLLTRFKFHAQPELASMLADRMIDAIHSQGSSGANLLVPVPLSDPRMALRGYNQSWELTRRIARHFQLPTLADGLMRGRDTPHQVGLERAAREANLRHSMWATAPAAAVLRGRRVALIDDVMTTGATVEVATRALRAAGAEHVQVWVLARTPRTA